MKQGRLLHFLTDLLVYKLKMCRTKMKTNLTFWIKKTGKIQTLSIMWTRPVLCSDWSCCSQTVKRSAPPVLGKYSLSSKLFPSISLVSLLELPIYPYLLAYFLMSTVSLKVEFHQSEVTISLLYFASHVVSTNVSKSSGDVASNKYS